MSVHDTARSGTFHGAPEPSVICAVTVCVSPGCGVVLGTATVSWMAGAFVMGLGGPLRGDALHRTIAPVERVDAPAAVEQGHLHALDDEGEAVELVRQAGVGDAHLLADAPAVDLHRLDRVPGQSVCQPSTMTVPRSVGYWPR